MVEEGDGVLWRGVGEVVLVWISSSPPVLLSKSAKNSSASDMIVFGVCLCLQFKLCLIVHNSIHWLNFLFRPWNSAATSNYGSVDVTVETTAQKILHFFNDPLCVE